MPPRLLACTVLAALLSSAHAEPTYVISTRIAVDKSPLDLKPVTITSGATANQEQTTVVRYPLGWDLPRRLSETAAVPISPNSFGEEKLGWRIRYLAERDSKYVVLLGTAIYTAGAQLPRSVYGEESDPLTAMVMKEGKVQLVMLCDNKSQNYSFQTTTTHFQIFAVPGKTYTVRLQKGAKTVDAAVTCSLPSKGGDNPVPLASAPDPR